MWPTIRNRPYRKLLQNKIEADEFDAIIFAVANQIFFYIINILVKFYAAIALRKGQVHHLI